MPVYQPGIPTGLLNLDVDYQNLKDNFTALNDIFSVDHLPFANVSAQVGYHKAMHLVPVSTTTTNAPNNQPVVTPTATPGYGQAWSAQINDGYGLDEAMYWISGGGRVFQMTSNIQPSTKKSTSSGGMDPYTGGLSCIPGGTNGGFMVQFGVGKIDTASAGVTITFSPAFKSAPYVVATANTTTNDFVFAIVKTISASNFNTVMIQVSDVLPAKVKGLFNWIAIGQ